LVPAGVVGPSADTVLADATDLLAATGAITVLVTFIPAEACGARAAGAEVVAVAVAAFAGPSTAAVPTRRPQTPPTVARARKVALEAGMRERLLGTRELISGVVCRPVTSVTQVMAVTTEV
jgi:hypothetical protein